MISRRVGTVVLSALLGLSVAAGSQACDFCLLSQGLSPLDTLKGNGFKITERYTLLDRVYQGPERLGGAGARETHWTTELTGFCSPLPRLTLLLAVPYRSGATRGELDLEAEGGPALDRAGSGDASGIGDLSLLARYTFLTLEFPSGTTRVAGLIGVKLATGRTNATTDDGAEYLDSHLQPGTGSTDYLIGLSLSHALQRLSFAANLLGTLPTEGNFGDTRHKFGDALNYDASAKYRLRPAAAAPREPQVHAFLSINGEARGKETADGVTQENSGGNTVYAGPGIQLTLAPHWVFDLAYQAAVFHDLKGTQVGETSKTVCGMTYLY
jgi:hypothetical protein